VFAARQCNPQTEFDCTGGTGEHCIPLSQTCNRRNDCGNNADEDSGLCQHLNGSFDTAQEISFGSLYCVALTGKNPQVLPHFQLQLSVMALPSGTATKMNAGAQLQTFPYLTVSKLFPILRSQTFPFKVILHVFIELQT